mmetsp:Transcript_46950/g.121136  ORF Transcript_46950/g.121136 Transcript_46950/m.121136 type:complete len:200 (+) Transcript_46950:542-1141(+)
MPFPPEWKNSLITSTSISMKSDSCSSPSLPALHFGWTSSERGSSARPSTYMMHSTSLHSMLSTAVKNTPSGRYSDMFAIVSSSSSSTRLTECSRMGAAYSVSSVTSLKSIIIARCPTRLAEYTAHTRSTFLTTSTSPPSSAVTSSSTSSMVESTSSRLRQIKSMLDDTQHITSKVGGLRSVFTSAPFTSLSSAGVRGGV